MQPSVWCSGTSAVSALAFATSLTINNASVLSVTQCRTPSAFASNHSAIDVGSVTINAGARLIAWRGAANCTVLGGGGEVCACARERALRVMCATRYK
jgi:hypothetical protein